MGSRRGRERVGGKGPMDERVTVEGEMENMRETDGREGQIGKGEGRKRNLVINLISDKKLRQKVIVENSKSLA